MSHQTQVILKRVIDLTVSSVLLLILLPFLPFLTAIICLDSPGPVFFLSTRVGRKGMPFTMYKLRTMRKDAESRLKELQTQNLGGAHMIKIPHDPRITRIGAFLRKTSIDELPQLWNVLKGEMSLVGPRPQAPNEVALYTPEQRHRLDVLPGITGLWQVTARHVADFDEWVRLDLHYIKTWSFWLDISIMLKTVGVVLRSKGGEVAPKVAVRPTRRSVRPVRYVYHAKNHR